MAELLFSTKKENKLLKTEINITKYDVYYP